MLRRVWRRFERSQMRHVQTRPQRRAVHRRRSRSRSDTDMCLIIRMPWQSQDSTARTFETAPRPTEPSEETQPSCSSAGQAWTSLNPAEAALTSATGPGGSIRESAGLSSRSATTRLVASWRTLALPKPSTSPGNATDDAADGPSLRGPRGRQSRVSDRTRVASCAARCCGPCWVA